MSFDIGNQSLKKPRLSEIVPISRIPMINKSISMPPNSVVPLPPLINFNYGNEGRFSCRPWGGMGIQEGNFEICRMFHYGRMCTYGDRCRFLHEIPDRIKNDIVDKRSGFDQFEVKKSGEMEIGSRNVFAKTRFCYHWQSTGRCPYVTCRFAHGEAELQKVGCCSIPERRSVYNASATTSAAFEAGSRSNTRTTYAAAEAGLRSYTGTAAANAELKSNTGIGTDHGNMVSKVKRLFKSSEPVIVKLNGIYADWLED